MLLGSIRDPGKKALSNMGRRIFSARVILILFVAYTVCLPLGHTCFVNTTSSLDQGTQPFSTPNSSADRSFRSSPDWLGELTVSEDGGPCLACLWSQTLLSKNADAATGIPQLFATRTILTDFPVVVTDNIFGASTNRGPPPHRLPA
jgi:hypothetical protein